MRSLCWLPVAFSLLCSAAADARVSPARVVAFELQAQRDGLRAVLSRMADHPEVFPAEELEEPRLLQPEARDSARALWAGFADLLLAVEQTERRVEGLEDADQLPGDEAFALRRAAFLARYRFAMDFIERARRDPGLESLFDEAQPELGLPERSYARLKFHYLNVARATEFAAVELLQRVRRPRTFERLARDARSDAKRILLLGGGGTGPKMTAENAVKVAGDIAFSAWLPAQERIARWAGEVRVRRRGEALISAAQVAELRQRLEPGDVLLQRREWYLTNAGIPGFWTHAALYVGTESEREAFFDEPEVARWAREQGHDSFGELLAARHPRAVDGSRSVAEGHPVRVLEAIAQGVTFTTLEESAHADSIAVLRPALSRRERAIALVRAFGYAGRPYDYEFDFATDRALVCSELVYKSYQPGAGTRGLELPLAPVAGRLMMTPNEIARRFTYTRGARRPPFIFVAMLDGSERSEEAHPATAEVFAESWRRPKWHIVTAHPPGAISP